VAKKKNQSLDKFQNFLFIAPAIAFFIVFSAYPLYKTFQLSLFSWDGIAHTMKFIGANNYLEAFKDAIWWKSIYNGFYFAIFALLLMNPLALLLAVAIYSGVRGSKIYKVVFYIPPIMSGIVIGYMWKWIYDPNNGILNSFLDLVHMGFLKRAWLSGLTTTLPAISIASIWQGFGGSFILFWAGLQDIPQEIYEAAEVDGVTSWQKLTKITLPMIKKTYTVITILTILGAMQILGLVIAMTNGGPGFESTVPSLRIYTEAFANYKFGYASALSVILGIMMLIISLVKIRMDKEKD
jgi:raffinose/stachyose/melibiose transport system permease protein